jgi:hypothetical protein
MNTKKKSQALDHVREIFGNEVADHLQRGVTNGYLPDEEEMLMDFAEEYQKSIQEKHGKSNLVINS